MANFVSLSSVGVSNALACNGLAKTTMAQITASGSAAGVGAVDYTLQCTLDNLGLVSSGVTSASWSNVSTTHYSTAQTFDGITITLLSPVAGLRLSSTAGALSTVNFLTLKMLQSLG